MRVLRLLLAWMMVVELVLPAEAQARKIYVNRSTGNDNWNGLSPTFTSGSTGPLRTIADGANWTAHSGDSCIIAPNDTVYDAAIRPVTDLTNNSGITWIGDSTFADTVIVPGFEATRNNQTVIGIRFTGLVKFDGKTSSVDGRYGYLRKCQVVSGLEVRTGEFSADNCTIGTGEDACGLVIGPGNDTGDSCALRTNTMHLLQRGTGIMGQHLIDFNPTSAPHVTMKDWVVTGNRCTLTIARNQVMEKTVMVNHLARGNFSDNWWVFRDSCGLIYGATNPFNPSATLNGNQAWVVRDSVKLCKFTNELVEFKSLIPGTGMCQGLIYSSGATQADSANTWKFCTFKSDVPTGSAPSFENQWLMAYRDSFYRNVVVTNTSSPSFKIRNVADSAFVKFNTFANLGGGNAFVLEADNCNSFNPAGRLVIAGNVFYEIGGSSAMRFIRPTASTSNRVYSDYNLFADYPGGRNNAETFGACDGSTPTRTGYPGQYNVDYERHSRFGSPLFADSSYATFDATPGVGSAAFGAGPSGTDCGAIGQPSFSPGAINDLLVTGSQDTRMFLTFTAPGSDGYTGTATSYVFKYSTTAITDANFASCNGVSTDAPQVAGSTEFVTVENLSPDHVYYFAVKAVNSLPMTGPISNVGAGRTRPITGTGVGHIDP